MKKTIIVAIVLAAALAGYLFYRHAASRPKAVVYAPITAALGEIKDIVTTSGNVEPLNRVVVKPPVAGRVEELLVEEGAQVKRGQVLAYISSTDRVAILDAARASGDSSKTKWAEETYKSTPVVSPLDGTVILRNVVQGQTLETSTSMFALSDDLIVKASVDESDIGRIKVGQNTVITLDAYPDEPVQGRVFQILYEGVTVSNVITYYVKIRPNHVPRHFKSEMSATIKVTVSDRKNLVLLPSATITEQKDGTKGVYKGDPKNPQFVAVTTGSEDASNTEIVSGVENGETVYYQSKNYKPQAAASSGSSPFMPSGPKRSSAIVKTTKNGKTTIKSSSEGNHPPPGM